MGWVGLAAVLVPLPELGAGLGLVFEADAGAEDVSYKHLTLPTNSHV